MEVRSVNGEVNVLIYGTLWYEFPFPFGRNVRISTFFSSMWKGGEEILKGIGEFARNNQIQEIWLRDEAGILTPEIAKEIFGAELVEGRSGG